MPETMMPADKTPTHVLHKSLGLRDLVPMQILIVIGTTWPGTAAHQAGTQVSFWLIGAALLFLPVAAVVHYCVQIWPYEGGVYQWTKHAFGPFAGFLSAWNLGAWVVILVSSTGLQTASGLSFALGPSTAWMAESHAVILGLNVGLFTGIFLVNVRGLHMGRWISHVGTATTLLVAALLSVLLFVHPHASLLHPHVAPQPSFLLQSPVLTLVSLNLFTKIAFNGFTGLEQVAVFAGETRNAARSILRSAWIAAPLIALIYILMTGSILMYTRADRVDLVNPVAQAVAAAFGDGYSRGNSTDWGLILGRASILAFTFSLVAQTVVYIAETSRLPMVAAWDHLLPTWFTRLHPRYGTPTRSLAVIVAMVVACSFLASFGAGASEAFQLLVTSAFICYGINYLLMFSVPLLVGTRFSLRRDLRPSWLLRAACVCGALVTMLSIIFNLVPIVDVASPWLFGLKVGIAALSINLLGAAIYWRGSSTAPFARSRPIISVHQRD
jgi:amino acid transporter